MAQQVIVSRNPEAGAYFEQQIFTEDVITSLAFPEVSASAQQLLA
jgi:Uma2 family endonuclease